MIARLCPLRSRAVASSRRRFLPALACLLCLLGLTGTTAAAGPTPSDAPASNQAAIAAEAGPLVIEATDSLPPALSLAAESAEAQAVLERIFWPTSTFPVHVEPVGGAAHHAVVTFPSPPVMARSGEVTARMRWYAARNGQGEVIEGPAILLVHSLHPQMIIANAIARGLASQGVHAFVIEMPGYGQRGEPGRAPAMVALEQAARTVAEVRRARDAIAALPAVMPGPIGLQGTSLGGFVAAVAGSLDGAFDPVLLLASGADGYTVLHNGRADAARVRELAYRTGYSDDELRRVLAMVDPRHVAHRLNPQRTWLYSAAGDQVIPRHNSDLLAATIGLTQGHHIYLPGNHYTVMLALPQLIARMGQTILGQDTATVEAEPAATHGTATR